VRLADGKERSIRYIASTTYWMDGGQISAQEFLKRLFGDLSSMVPDEDALRAAWSDPDNREQLLGQLLDRGYDQDKLEDMRQLVDAKNSDLYDVLAYILFANTPVTRERRAMATEQGGLKPFDGELKGLLLLILNAYVANGERELASRKLGQYLIARYGSVAEGKARLGELTAIREAYNRMQAALYSI
jgi:type I restriction enzyme R subunit